MTIFTFISSPKAKNDIIIPRTVKYYNFKYVITKIAKEAFKDNNEIESISFSLDSEIKLIEKDAFDNSSLQIISIPPKLEQLQDFV